MVRSGSMTLGISLGAVVAGPIFLTAMILAGLYLKLPAPITITPDQVGGFLLALLPATVVGAFVALPANAIGAMFMVYLSDHLAFARSPFAWALAGGSIGGFLAYWMASGNLDLELGFALVVTASVCGWLCSRWIIWDAGD